MPQNEEILRRTLAGIEGTRGAPATVNRKLYEQVRLADAREPLEFVENAGSYDGWRTFEQGVVTVTGTAEGPVSYEDAAWWNRLGIRGDVAGVADSGTPTAAVTRLYAPSSVTDNLASATMQTGVPDNVYTSAMVMANQWTIRGDVDGDATWMFTADLIGRSKDHLPGGFTAGVTDRQREFVKAAGTKLFLDDDAADLGDTQLLGKFISFSLTWNNAIAPKRFMEDEHQISTRVGRGARQITGQVRIEFDNDDEMEHYRQGHPRAIRIEREGSVIHGSVRKRIRIDVPRAYWLTPSDDPRNTNMTLTFGFRAYVDDTAGYPAAVEVVNALGAGAGLL
jgi:hypothetical protein